MGLVLLALLCAGPILAADQLTTSKLQWQKQLAPAERPPAAATDCWQYPATAVPPCAWAPAPVVLPKPSWPPPRQPASNRGWRLKEPAVGTGALVTSYEDQRTAVQMAQSAQESTLAKTTAAPPVLNDIDLPDELQQLNLRLDLGVEYRF